MTTATAFTMPPLNPAERIRAAARAVRLILRTGRLPDVEAYAHGMSDGMATGVDIALGEFNARLAAAGIKPIREVRP